jgi:hypothetical protein
MGGRRFRLGGAGGILVLGFAFITVAHVARPLGSLPLYDGAIVAEPYRFLDPPPANPPATPRPSDPTSSTEPMTIKNDKIPPMFAGTTESPPQAQMFTSGPVFDVPPGTATVVSTVTPVRSSVAPPNGHISGNVYHFSMATADGVEIPITAGKTVSVVLRIPEGEDESSVTIDWFDGQRWQPQATEPLGPTLPLLYKANATQLGDFAIVVPGAGATPAPLPSGQTLPPVPTPALHTPGPTPSATITPPTSTGGSGFNPVLAIVAVVLAGVLVGLGGAMLYLWRSRQ